MTNWDDLDLELAGDFILMAATLLEIKSRIVAPREEAAEQREEDEALDPGADLIRQLLAFRKAKEAMQLLEAQERIAEERLPRTLRELIPEDPEEVDGIDLANCDAGALWTVFERVLSRIDGLGPRTVLVDDQPMEQRVNALIDTMRSAREGRLSWIFEREPHRLARVGAFLAALECVRQRFIEALQHQQYGEVYLRWCENRDTQPPPDGPPPGTDEPAAKRRRRPALVTWHAPAAGAEQQVLEEVADEIEEAPQENDEERFARELEAASGVDAILGRIVDIEADFQRWQAELAAVAEAPPAAVDMANAAAQALAGPDPA